MDEHIEKFYHQSAEEAANGHFHEVVALHVAADIGWDDIIKKTPNLPRGWYELAQLNGKDRIEFSRDFWLSKIPYHPALDAFLNGFFSSLDDIGVFIMQRSWDDPFKAEIVYSIANNGGFYRGGLPAGEEELGQLQKAFPHYLLPVDYLAFLQIHNGFWKATDCTGILRSSEMSHHYLSFQEALAKLPPLMTTANDAVNPKSLIPFYESFGMPYYQCFWGEWYPNQEMGNVYYSSSTMTISPVKEERGSPETMAFPSFTDWLIFYLERVA